ncbi:MAG: hypothetical protein AXW12_19760 [Thalassospira sp. Nap_22]|nr:MAG: hypothetical protein AXW12_19760 [Thalassospira sp. Nap_22]
METKIITVCGSTRYLDVIAVVCWLLERDENAMTFGLHSLPQWYPDCPPHHLAEHEGVADKLGKLHLAKIDRSDEIFVVDFDGYIGTSTLEQIRRAKARGIPVRYFSDDPIGVKVREIGEQSKKSPEGETLYAFSVNDDERYHEDLFDALEAAEVQLEPGLELKVMRGKRVMFRASRFTPNVVDELLSGMDQESDWEGGEFADDWPGNNIPDAHEKDLESRIDAAVDAWADVHGYQPTFYQVQDVNWVKIRIVDVDAKTFDVIDGNVSKSRKDITRNDSA